MQGWVGGRPVGRWTYIDFEHISGLGDSAEKKQFLVEFLERIDAIHLCKLDLLVATATQQFWCSVRHLYTPCKSMRYVPTLLGPT